VNVQEFLLTVRRVFPHTAAESCSRVSSIGPKRVTQDSQSIRNPLGFLAIILLFLPSLTEYVAFLTYLNHIVIVIFYAENAAPDNYDITKDYHYYLYYRLLMPSKPFSYLNLRRYPMRTYVRRYPMRTYVDTQCMALAIFLKIIAVCCRNYVDL